MKPPSGAQWPWIAPHAVKKDILNKTCLDVEVLYFKFVGQISCKSHEYYTCNTSISMGQRGEGRSGCSSHRQLCKKSRSGSSHREMREWRGLMPALVQRCLACAPAVWSLSRETLRHWANLLNFSPYVPHRNDQWRLPPAPAEGTTPGLCLISSLIEIHTASLAWLSCPPEAGGSQQEQRSAPLFWLRNTHIPFRTSALWTFRMWSGMLTVSGI